MFSSQDNQFSRKLDFLTVLWNMSISCNHIIFRRKHPFLLKRLGYSKDHEGYIWQKFQLEIPSFARGHCCWIFEFSKSKSPKKIRKSKIRRFPLGCNLTEKKYIRTISTREYSTHILRTINLQYDCYTCMITCGSHLKYSKWVGNSMRLVNKIPYF